VFGCIADNCDAEEAKQSLLFYRFLESVLHLDEIIFLLLSAHYTSGIQILRYRLESAIQAFYLDQQHPLFSLENKICILAEISDKREYFVSRLIDRMSGERESLRKIYKELSMVAHPSHLDFPTVEEMMKYGKADSNIDCTRLGKAAELAIRTYDAIFFLVIQNFPAVKDIARKQKEIKKVIGKYKLPMLNKVIS
jgi:hypothetical protein